MNLKNKIKKEIKKKLKHYISRGKEWIAIHKDTARHILKLLNSKK